MYPIEKYQYKVYEKTNKDGTKSSVVVAITTYCGKVVKGIAKCQETDPFSLDLGTRLAAARCDLKVCLKRIKRASAKYNESEKMLNEVKEYNRRMGNYYSDSLSELSEAQYRLNKIESELM